MPSQAEKLTELLDAKRAYDDSAAAIVHLEQGGVLSSKQAKKVVACFFSTVVALLCINLTILI